MSDIALSGAVRRNLNSLQTTSSLIGRTQNILSTGKKINGPVDDANAFFKARSLENRASDFDGVKDGIKQAISSVEAAENGIKAITKLVEQLDGILQSAKQTSDTTQLQAQYDSVIAQLNGIATDASYGGKNLIAATGETLSVAFNEDASQKLDIASVDLTTTGLSISAAADFDDGANVTTAEGEVKAALTTLRSQSASFGTNASILSIREDFTTDYTTTLKDGAGKLTLADLNEEGANLLALQTRQQLGINSLSLSAQSEQSILRLF